MKISTYEPQYDKAGKRTIGMKKQSSWLDINYRYVKRMHSFYEKGKFEGKFYWMFYEGINGLLIDKKTYLKLSKLLE